MSTKRAHKAVVKKAQTTPLLPISMEDVQNKIVILRGEPVILDRDVATLYGVETREINQAIKNNPGKFPAGNAPSGCASVTTTCVAFTINMFLMDAPFRYLNP